MWWFLLAVAANAITVDEAVDAAVARAPAMDVSRARVDEAKARQHEVRSVLLPNASLTAGLVAQTKIEVDLGAKIPITLPEPIEPLLVQPGGVIQGGALLTQPIIAPAAWAGQRAARHGVGLAEGQADADRQALSARVVQVFHGAAQAHAVLEDAVRAQALTARLLEKGRTLVELGAAAKDQIIPFERAHASARANVALARAGAESADGTLALLTGLTGAPELPAEPPIAPDLATLLAQIDRPDLRALDRGADAANAQIEVQRAGRYPTVGLQASLSAVTPVPDFGEALIWRVGLGATVPLFQGGAVSGRIDQAQARAAQSRAGRRAASEGAELEVRGAHGALTQALSSLQAQDEAVAFAERAVAAAELRAKDGGGSLLQLQQAQLEQIVAEASRTRARSTAAMASDALKMAVQGGLGKR